MDTQAPIRRAGRATPYLFLAPYLVLFGVFVVLPGLYGLWISLHDWDFLLPRKPWVGLRNYQNLFSPESRDFGDFWQSMKATGLFTLFSVPFLVVVPLLVALLLDREFPGRTFFRAVFFAPYVLGVAVVGVLWRFLLDPNIGLINNMLSASFPWTTDLPWAWVSLVGMTVWWTLGFNAIIFLAGLQDISRELYDAAKVDGANRWQLFLHVTLPGLKPVLLLVLTMTILGSANMFGQSYLVTRGAPANETRTAIMFIADTGLRTFRMGNAAAMSYVLALALLVVSAFNFRLLRHEDT
ncbi:sugar ABC transporter permease [Cystobacter fuscus]|uniref:carbohydrate ABC transporter permease n=1 Tax=Cystobacter fuscus TaxID=43 RepID=UPI002B2B56E9|nr:sugar ABC transporter permease [Cystobacter fuscus]